jgi:hypothetical protein
MEGIEANPGPKTFHQMKEDFLKMYGWTQDCPAAVTVVFSLLATAVTPQPPAVPAPSMGKVKELLATDDTARQVDAALVGEIRENLLQCAQETAPTSGMKFCKFLENSLLLERVCDRLKRLYV